MLSYNCSVAFKICLHYNDVDTDVFGIYIFFIIGPKSIVGMRIDMKERVGV